MNFSKDFLNSLSDKELEHIANNQLDQLSDQTLSRIAYKPKEMPKVDAMKGMDFSPGLSALLSATNPLNLVPNIQGIKAGLAGLVKDPLGKDSFEKPYIQSRDEAQSILSEAHRQNPWSSIGGGIVSGLASGLGSTGLKMLSGGKALASPAAFKTIESMIEPLLTKSSSMTEAGIKAAKLAIPVGLAQQPVSPKGEITPIQPLERLTNAAISAPIAFGLGAGFQRLGEKGKQSVAAKEIRDNPVAVQDKFYEMVNNAESDVSKLALEAKKRAQAAAELSGLKGEINVSDLTRHPYTDSKRGEPILQDLIPKLQSRIKNKPIGTERLADDIKYGGQTTQMPLTQQQNVSALPVPETDLNQFPLRNFSIDERGSFPGTIGGQEQMFNALNQAKVVPNNVRMSNVIPANTPKAPLTTEQMRKLLAQGRIDELTRSRGELAATMGAPQTINQPVQIQQSLGLRATPAQAKGIPNPIVEASPAELLQAKEALDDAVYGLKADPGQSVPKLRAFAAANNYRDQLYKMHPEVEPNLRKASDLLGFNRDVLGKLDTDAILAKFKAGQGTDAAALFQRIDQQLGGNKFGSQNKLLSDAMSYDKQGRFFRDKIPGGLGRLLYEAGAKFGQPQEMVDSAMTESLPFILNSLSQQRAVKKR